MPWSAPRPGSFSPGNDTYPLYWGLGKPQGWSGWVHSRSLLPGFDAWTIKLIASCYTDYTIPACVYLNMYILRLPTDRRGEIERQKERQIKKEASCLRISVNPVRMFHVAIQYSSRYNFCCDFTCSLDWKLASEISGCT